MLTYQNIIEFVDRCLPEFSDYKDDEELRENKIIYFNFLTIFIVKNLGDEELTKRIALLINRMTESTDVDVKILLDDFLLSIFSYSQEKKMKLDSLLKELSSEAKERFTSNLQLWIKGNRA